MQIQTRVVFSKCSNSQHSTEERIYLSERGFLTTELTTLLTFKTRPTTKTHNNQTILRHQANQTNKIPTMDHL